MRKSREGREREKQAKQAKEVGELKVGGNDRSKGEEEEKKREEIAARRREGDCIRRFGWTVGRKTKDCTHSLKLSPTNLFSVFL